MANFGVVRAVKLCKFLSRGGNSSLRTYGLRYLSSGDKNVVKSPFAEIELAKQATINEYIFDNITPFHDKIATQCGVTGRSYTYEDLKVKSRNLNRALRKKLRLQKNDVVAVMLPNVPEFPIVILGTLMAGLRATTLNPIYTQDEVKKQLQDSGAKAIITLSDFHGMVSNATGNKMPVICINTQQGASLPAGAINIKELMDEKLDIEDIHLDDPNSIAMMPYSSGTTGLPKGVLLSHRNIIANIQQFSSPNFRCMEYATDTFQEIIPAVLPMFHIYGFTAICLASLISGSKIITLPKFTPELYLSTLKETKPTILMAVPPIVIFLNMHPAVTPELLSNVRILLSGAAPLGALDEMKFKEKMGSHIHVLQGYGLSEASPVVTMVPVVRGPQPGSTGNIVPNTTVKIVPADDPNGEALGPNQTGELFVKGPQVMLGYHNRPEETANTLVDGWLRTGDMFYYDDNEIFYITDRIKELIKVKGFQVPPAELEEIIRSYPGVMDTAVIGIPHEQHGEVPRAYVVPKPNIPLDVKKLDGYINEKVAEYKKLRGGIAVVEAIPKNASGKILRRQLKLQYEKDGQ